MSRRFSVSVAYCIIFALAFAVIPALCHAESVSITPFKIILNAQCVGQSQDIQAIISKSMPSTYHIDEYDVTLSFNGVEVASAFAFRYCYIDSNFLASFDREAIQADPYVASLASGEAVATVSGWFTVRDNEGNPIYDEDGDQIKITFSGDDTVEILNPKKK